MRRLIENIFIVIVVCAVFGALVIGLDAAMGGKLHEKIFSPVDDGCTENFILPLNPDIFLKYVGVEDNPLGLQSSFMLYQGKIHYIVGVNGELQDFTLVQACWNEEHTEMNPRLKANGPLTLDDIKVRVGTADV